MRKITGKYFNKDYWMTKGKRSGYSPQQGYTRQDFQWEAIAVMLRDIFGDDKKYLEAGCAFGWIVEWFVKDGIQVCGFDISQYAIEHAPLLAKGWVICLDGFDLPYGDNVFDVLYTLETVEHIAPDDVDRWWRELYRVLKPGAQVFAAVCVGNDNKRGVDDIDKSHQTLQPIEWWYEKLSELGFTADKDLEQELYKHKVKTNRLDEPLCLAEYYDWRILGLRRNAV